MSAKQEKRISQNKKVPFVAGEYYHVYNRGVEKRNIFSDEYDLQRFFQSMTEFNSLEPIGSIYEQSFGSRHQLGSSTPKLGANNRLVDFVAYCLNPNHYHFLLTPLKDKGIEIYASDRYGLYKLFQ